VVGDVVMVEWFLKRKTEQNVRMSSDDDEMDRQS
jgi:hypothetical protein